MAIKTQDLINNSPDTNETQSFVYLFCSFDIVESTYLKSINPQWAKLFNQFYDWSVRDLEKLGFEFWKYVGDEVLFYKKLEKKDLENFHLIPSKVFNSMNSIQNELHKEYQNTKMFLALKGTLWISKVIEPSLVDLNKSYFINDNIVIKKLPKLSYSVLPQVFIDFLGPEIDLGFRISKFSMKNQLIVSAEFVQLHFEISRNLDKHSAVLKENCYRLLIQTKLKGIWHKREYPIVLYRPFWDEQAFEYDEKDYRVEDLDENVFEYLSYVFSSIGKIDEIKDYYSIIDNTEVKIETQLKIESPVDIHLAAILFNDSRVLLMKRGLQKSSPNKWDFGCTNLKVNQRVEDALKSYYNFPNAEIEIILNSDTNKPIPVALYEYEKNQGKVINGLLFVGKIILNEEFEGDFHGYEKINFFEMDELFEQEGIELFPDSKPNIKRAYKILNDEIKK
ncbi:hypothetical protein [Streptococcus vestibularis]|uniref:hypothetical protein n=1 Tax=Streptococcus vestibularis TaxID=1343 RepID=UPI00241E2703|nr:hypothetical protein [Streptococcus vestibularis]MBS6506014.1 hypothetical protein [Streptococcus vestibularis]MCI5926047.1 hypothetical protein [Streptococcus vestibularis]